MDGPFNVDLLIHKKEFVLGHHPQKPGRLHALAKTH